MNLDAPHCARCAGTRFFHLRRMRDAQWTADDSIVWHDRPVAVGRTPIENAPTDEIAPFGHFETLVCRGCGLTVWYAFEWEQLHAPRSPARCDECASETPHVRIPAVEIGDTGFEQPRITRGLVGREGFLSIEICERCGRVEWIGSRYQHLEPRRFVAYQLREEPERPCLHCHATDALVDEAAREHTPVTMPIAVVKRSWLRGFIQMDKSIGHFSLRLCRPCGAVEWYARGFEALHADPALGISSIGDRPEPVSVGGPYR